MIADLVDRQAVADLVHAYARAIRYRDPEAAAALLAQDGAFEVREGLPGEAGTRRVRLEGRAAFLAYLRRDAVRAPGCPVIHNLMIALDGDTARANSVMENQILGTSHRITGEYHDTCRRVDGQWRFAERVFTIFRVPEAIPAAQH